MVFRRLPVPIRFAASKRMRVVLGVWLFAWLTSCGAARELRCPAATSASPRAGGEASLRMAGSAPVLVGAGDIADCRSCAESTASLLDAIPGTVFMAGDGAYEDGSIANYEECYAPTWGRHKERTRPAPGNHEYKTDDAAGYFEYFGAAAGTPGQGWYSFEIGEWHVVVLNSNCAQVGCGEGSLQLEWLEADLASSDAACTAAIFHHARFASGKHGENREVAPFWEALYRHGAEVVLNGHDHSYERLAPISPAGESDPGHGLRSFVVGTGGVGFHEWSRRPLRFTEVRDNETWGVLRLDLRADGYDWEFIPADPDGFRDSGTGSCHGPRRGPPDRL